MKRIFYILLFGGLLVSCDSFQEDVEPVNDDVLVIKDAMRTVPNTPLYIDLKRDIRSSQAVRFGIEKLPDKGIVAIYSNAILEYKPHQTFTSGSDFFALSLEDESGQTLDIDSMYISMGSADEGNLDHAWSSCERTALSDFYQTTVNEEVSIFPLENDGFCDSSYQSFEVSILEEPKNGTLSKVFSQFENYSYTYQPEIDFIGEDEFMYDVTYIDSLGNEQYSLAKVFITISDSVIQSCDSAVYPFYYVITDSLDHVDFMPFDPMADCPISDWTVEIEAVASGDVEILESGLIRYYPGYEDIDSINYQVTFLETTYRNTITIFLENVVRDSTFCTNAEDDWYYLNVLDSIGRSDNPFFLDILTNDMICSDDDVIVSLLTEPDVGDAYLDSANQMVYYVDQEFAGVREFDMLYEICGPDLCDSAFIHLTIEQ